MHHSPLLSLFFVAFYRGPPFLTVLEELPTIQRMFNAPVRMPIMDKMKVRLCSCLCSGALLTYSPSG